jgi:hypothetical protein
MSDLSPECVPKPTFANAGWGAVRINPKVS